MNVNHKFAGQEGLYEIQPHRVGNILLVSTLYDAFIMERDGHILEQIYNEFLELKVVYIPKITRAFTLKRVEELLAARKFDLVITMMNLPGTDVFSLAQIIKDKDPTLPVVLLLNDPSTIAVIDRPHYGLIDGVFLWSGDPALYFAIIKYVEDQMNVAHDVSTGLVKVVLVIEDSVKYYSRFLPMVYGEIMKQTQLLIKEGLNALQRLIRLRARPKILHAGNFESATRIFSKYKDDILGIISDIAFPKDKEMHDTAGFEFAQYVRRQIHDKPFILMSYDNANKERAQAEGLSYLNKNSPTLQNDLKNFIAQNMGFGDFVFRSSAGKEVARASNIRELQELILTVPEDSLLYHASGNHISLWLIARGEYEIAHEVKPKQVSDFGGDIAKLRQYLYKSIAAYRDMEQRGIVVQYKPGDWDSTLIQIGSGSLGGKGRGIAFVNYLLAVMRHNFQKFPIAIPKTVAIAAEKFDEFMRDNRIEDVLDLQDDHKVAARFLAATLSNEVRGMLRDFLQHCRKPIAVRSSSLLEDSQFLPFAGIYKTYMLPNNHNDLETRLEHLMRAVKLVYASVFYHRSRSYIESSPYEIDEEKMGIAIQEVVGEKNGGYFYPAFSGLAQSYNYYPVSHMKSTEGVAQIALGLGRLVIEGGDCLRFSPKYPEVIPQFATVSSTFKSAQKNFYALDLTCDAGNIFLDENVTLSRIDVKEERRPKIVNLISSLYDAEDHTFKEDFYGKGPRVVTFANILKYNMFPLTHILVELLDLLKTSMGKDIEIEFAVDVPEASEAQAIFYLLQVRPLTVNREPVAITDEERDERNLVASCANALGNGFSETCDIVFVDPDRFDKGKTRDMAEEVRRINSTLKEEGRRYLLIVLGRLGTSDPWLGIPANWEHISNVMTIVEAGIEGFEIEPSQGTHFFQNITSRGIGYFSLTQTGVAHFLDWGYLKSLPIKSDSRFVTHVRSLKPVQIKIDGRSGEGVILKPSL